MVSTNDNQTKILEYLFKEQNEMKRPDIYQKIIKIAKAEDYDIVPEFAYTQFIHETNNFQSRLFKEGNNVSGMKPSSRKLHLGVFDNPEGSATYATIDDSILDYIRRLKQRIMKNSPVVPYKDPDLFFREMIRTKYAEDENYYKALMATYKKHFPNGSTVVATASKVLSKVGIPITWKTLASVVAFTVCIVVYLKEYKPWRKLSK